MPSFKRRADAHAGGRAADHEDYAARAEAVATAWTDPTRAVPTPAGHEPCAWLSELVQDPAAAANVTWGDLDAATQQHLVDSLSVTLYGTVMEEDNRQLGLRALLKLKEGVPLHVVMRQLFVAHWSQHIKQLLRPAIAQAKRLDQDHEAIAAYTGLGDYFFAIGNPGPYVAYAYWQHASMQLQVGFGDHLLLRANGALLPVLHSRLQAGQAWAARSAPPAAAAAAAGGRVPPVQQAGISGRGAPAPPAPVTAAAGTAAAGAAAGSSSGAGAFRALVAALKAIAAAIAGAVHSFSCMEAVDHMGLRDSVHWQQQAAHDQLRAHGAKVMSPVNMVIDDLDSNMAQGTLLTGGALGDAPLAEVMRLVALTLMDVDPKAAASDPASAHAFQLWRACRGLAAQLCLEPCQVLWLLAVWLQAQGNPYTAPRDGMWEHALRPRSWEAAVELAMHFIAYAAAACVFAQLAAGSRIPCGRSPDAVSQEPGAMRMKLLASKPGTGGIPAAVQLPHMLLAARAFVVGGCGTYEDFWGICNVVLHDVDSQFDRNLKVAAPAQAAAAAAAAASSAGFLTTAGATAGAAVGQLIGRSGTAPTSSLIKLPLQEPVPLHLQWLYLLRPAMQAVADARCSLIAPAAADAAAGAPAAAATAGAATEAPAAEGACSDVLEQLLSAQGGLLALCADEGDAQYALGGLKQLMAELALRQQQRQQQQPAAMDVGGGGDGE